MSPDLRECAILRRFLTLAMTSLLGISVVVVASGCHTGPSERSLGPSGSGAATSLNPARLDGIWSWSDGFTSRRVVIQGKSVRVQSSGCVGGEDLHATLHVDGERATLVPRGSAWAVTEDRLGSLRDFDHVVVRDQEFLVPVDRREDFDQHRDEEFREAAEHGDPEDWDPQCFPGLRRQRRREEVAALVLDHPSATKRVSALEEWGVWPVGVEDLGFLRGILARTDREELHPEAVSLIMTAGFDNYYGLVDRKVHVAARQQYLSLLRDHPSPEVRKRVAGRLTHGKHFARPKNAEEDIPALLQAWREDKEPVVRNQAAMALGTLGCTEVSDYLFRLLETSPEVDVRQELVYIVTCLDPGRAEPILHALASAPGEDLWVRKCAIEELAETLKPENVALVLELVFHGQDEDIEEAALSALDSSLLQTEFTLSEAGIERVASALLDLGASSSVRVTAANLLHWIARARDKQAIAALDAAARLDPDESVQAKAAEALARIREGKNESRSEPCDVR